MAFEQITQHAVERCRKAPGAHRVSFSDTRANQPARSDPPYVGRFTIPAENCAEKLLRADTGVTLFRSNYANEVWRSIRTESEFQVIHDWARGQGTRVFLRDCLDLSVALDMNLVRDDDGEKDHTPIGALESRAKSQPDAVAIEALVEHFCRTIRGLPFYRDAPIIAAIPPRPGKAYDLPQTLATRIAAALGITDITGNFQFSGSKGTIKALPVEEKWTAWAQAGLDYSQRIANAPSVILVDDKYQSGITLQYVASRLRAAGAGAIYGLCAVKTWRNTDNA